MLKEKYTFILHSFVDLITNSSTEIYIEATDKTVKSLENLINSLLKLGGSHSTCDDLFTIEIDKEKFKKDYSYDKDCPDYDTWEKEDYHEDYKSISLLVKCRDENNSLGKETASILSDLTGMFNIDRKSTRL